MNLENFQVRKDTSYPEIVGAKNDPNTVAILKNLASSANASELLGILTYVFQSVEADKSAEDIAKVLEEIAVVEMTHLDMLMHAITEFGGVAKYEDSMGRAFHTNYINYNLRLKDMLEQNIMAETRAIENYNNAIKKVSNDSLKALFARIIEDEECHIKIFKYLKDSVQFLSC